MKIKLGALAVISGAVMFSLALPAFGQYYGPYTAPPALSNGEQVNLTFTGGYTAVDYNVGGYDVGAGIYSGVVNGTNPTGIICDDFNDEITSGETWGAAAYQVSTLNSGNISEVLFGGADAGHANIGTAGYAAIAYLVAMQEDSIGNSTLQGDISEAIWSISDPGLTGVDSAAQTLALQAEAYASGDSDNLSQYSNLWILTPTTLGTGQEQWIEVPEGGAALLYLLLAGGVCFGAMFLKSRNGFANLASA